jgi:hypothetical protein
MSISTYVRHTRCDDISSKGTLEYELFIFSFLNIIRIYTIENQWKAIKSLKVIRNEGNALSKKRLCTLLAQIIRGAFEGRELSSDPLPRPQCLPSQ